MASGSRNAGKKTHRPLLASVALTVQVPHNLTDDEVLAKLKQENVHAKWTDATYTTGPDGDKKDDGGGFDIPW